MESVSTIFPFLHTCARARILKHFLEECPISNAAFYEIAEEAEGLSYRELRNIVQVAGVQESRLRNEIYRNVQCTEEELREACKVVMAQHASLKKEDWWEKNKQTLQTAAPLILQAVGIIIGIYMQYASSQASLALATLHHNQQMALLKQNHKESMSVQILQGAGSLFNSNQLHESGVQLSEVHVRENQVFNERCSERSLLQAERGQADGLASNNRHADRAHDTQETYALWGLGVQTLTSLLGIGVSGAIQGAAARAAAGNK